MADKPRRVVYIGSAAGLYRMEVNGDTRGPELMGLEGKGALRAPLLVDRSDRRRLYAATSRAGVCRSEDGGKSWREINEGIIYKEAWSLVQHPETGEIYVGTGPSSIFKSRDGGDSWEDLEQLRSLPETKDWTFPNPPHVSHVKGMALSPANPSIIFGAIEEGWIVRSKDGGKTWQNIKQGTEFDSHYVAVMPDDSSVVIATSGQGLYRSTNGGDSFEERSEGLDCRYLAQIAVHPACPHVLFTAAAAVPPPGWRRPEGARSAFYKSEDQGLSWRRLSGGLPGPLKGGPRAVAGDPEDPDTVFVGMSDGSVWMSDNSGESFRLVVRDLSQVTSISVTR